MDSSCRGSAGQRTWKMEWIQSAAKKERLLPTSRADEIHAFRSKHVTITSRQEARLHCSGCSLHSISFLHQQDTTRRQDHQHAKEQICQGSDQHPHHQTKATHCNQHSTVVSALSPVQATVRVNTCRARTRDLDLSFCTACKCFCLLVHLCLSPGRLQPA